MSRVWIVGIIGVIVIGVAGYLFMNNNKSVSPSPTETMTQAEATPMPTPMAAMEQTIILAEQNKSKESGTAVLAEKDGKVVVTLSVTGAPSDIPQPAHIHMGSCPDVGAVVYPLTNLVNGQSVTTLNVTLAQLAAQQPLGINVHKSVSEIKVYTACGNLAIPRSSSDATPVASSAPTMGQTNMGY